MQPSHLVLLRNRNKMPYAGVEAADVGMRLELGTVLLELGQALDAVCSLERSHRDVKRVQREVQYAVLRANGPFEPSLT